jgi:hypothetical protein
MLKLMINLPDMKLKTGTCVHCGKQIQKSHSGDYYIHTDGMSHVCFFEDGCFYFAEPIDDLVEFILNHWIDKDVEKFSVSLAKKISQCRKTECNLCQGSGMIQQPLEPYLYVKCYACGGDGKAHKI